VKNYFFVFRTYILYHALTQGSQTQLGARATLQDITQLVGRIVSRDNKMQ